MSSLSSWITRAALPLMSNRSFVKSIGKSAWNSKKNALKFATRPGCGNERSLRMQRHPQQHVREFSSARAMSKIMAMAGDDVGRGPKTDSKVAIETSELKQFSREAMKKVMEEAKELSKRKPSVDHNLSTEGLKDRIKDGIALMQTGLVERDTEVRLLLLAALSGEHILYIGPPGTAKSELGRRLSSLCEGQFFERLLTRFSVPEELFGPLSMRALEEDQYIRQTDGYLPKATVAFIDEIFKANSAILNTLLTVLNERLFDNGSAREKVPLLCMVGASNELPESEELDALYDRFLIRKKVDQVSAGGGGRKVIRVEISLDDGKSWRQSTIHRFEKPNAYGKYWCWVFWELTVNTFDFTQCKEVLLRAWDSSQNGQPAMITWNVMGMMNNCYFRIPIHPYTDAKGQIGLRFQHPAPIEVGELGNIGWREEDNIKDQAIKAALNPEVAPPVVAVKETKAETSAKTYTMEEVEKHDDEESCWFVHDGKVYDATPFLEDHPGGGDSILIVGGQDATEEFDAIHSADAKNQLKDYLLGDLAK